MRIRRLGYLHIEFNDKRPLRRKLAVDPGVIRALVGHIETIIYLAGKAEPEEGTGTGS